jgi:hypothetical protein
MDQNGVLMLVYMLISKTGVFKKYCSIQSMIFSNVIEEECGRGI